MDTRLLIAKLLALAVDQSDKPEGILALEKAEDLIEKYNFNREDFLGAEASDLVREVTIQIPTEGWALDLLTSVAYFCAAITFKLETGDVILFGRSFHIEMAILFYKQILRQLDESIRNIEGAGLWDAEEINDWRASFVIGAEKRLHAIGINSSLFREIRDACLDAAERALNLKFPSSMIIANYSRRRKRVEAAYATGASVEVHRGIGLAASRLLKDHSDS